MTTKTHDLSSVTPDSGVRPVRRNPPRLIDVPENLLEDLLRARSLNCGLESLGYPHFLVKLYRRALHSRGVMG